MHWSIQNRGIIIRGDEMADLNKITDSDISSYGVVSSPDTLTGTAAENKAIFDKLIRECVKEIVNNAIDKINSMSGNVTDIEAALNGKVDKIIGKGLSSNDYTDAEQQKLATIEAGAQQNTVSSVAGKTGAVILSKSDVGLGNIDNTSDMNKPVSTAVQTALNKKANLSGGNAFSGDQTMYGDVSMYSHVHMGGDLYVTQGAVIDNVDAWNNPGLEVNHYPMTGEEQPCVRFKSRNVEIANLDHTGQLWKGDKKYVTETELGTKADLAGGNNFSGTQIMNGDADIYGHAKLYNDLYVQNSAEINNEGYPYRPGLVVDNWPEEDMEGNIAPIVRFENKGVETARVDHTGQIWKGNEKYITDTELPQSYANALTNDTAELETIVLSDQQPDTHMNTFTVYGVSQQDGTPTPDTPVEVVSAEDFDTVCENSDGSTVYTAHITGAMRGIPKTGGWAFRDYIESDGISVWKVQECGYAVLTGAESWSVSGNTIADGTVFSITLPDQDKSTTQKLSLLSNRFTALKSGTAPKLGNTWQTNVTFFATPNTDTGITSEDTNAVKLQKYKAWLAENNVTIMYQLASPVRTDITGTELGQAILSAVRTKNIISVRTEYGDKNPVIPIDTQELSGTNTPLRPLYKVNYNQDINQAIRKLEQIIVSLGGVI